jgi:DNA mismatch repair ATPase MutS
MNVAKMALIPKEILEVAEAISSEFDSKHSSKKTDLSKTPSLQSLACFKVMMKEQNLSVLSRANISC